MSVRLLAGTVGVARLPGTGFEGAGLGPPLHVPQQAGIVPETGLHVRMGGPECLLEERQGPLIERFRLGIPAQRLVEHRQIAQSHGHVRVLWPQETFLYGQGLLAYSSWACKSAARLLEFTATS
jgi:hypothetical protein